MDACHHAFQFVQYLKVVKTHNMQTLFHPKIVSESIGNGSRQFKMLRAIYFITNFTFGAWKSTM
jgi:hypothetical protein